MTNKDETTTLEGVGSTVVLERELLLCPHCGKTKPVRLTRSSEDENWDSSNPDGFAIVCDASSLMRKGPGGCGAQGGYALTENDAVEKWNMRANFEGEPLPTTDGETKK